MISAQQAEIDELKTASSKAELELKSKMDELVARMAMLEKLSISKESAKAGK